ncbi:MAG: ATP-binding protein [Candidatus Fermentibacteraceae bacterium]
MRHVAGRLTWLQVGRLAVLGLLSILGIAYLRTGPVRIIYTVVAATTILTATTSWLAFRKSPLMGWPYWLLFSLDGLLLGLIVHYAGGMDGPLVVFFYLHAAVAGLYLGIAGGISMALLDMLVLATSGLFALSGSPPEYTGGILGLLERSGLLALSTEYVLLRSFLDGLILASIGLVSGYLSEHLAVESSRLQQLLRALRETRSRSREILENLENGVLVIDNSGGLVNMNASFKRIVRLDEDSGMEELGEKRVYRLLRDYLRSGMFPDNIDLVLDDRIVECRMGHFLDDRGQKAGAIAVLNDVTELRNLRSRLEEREKLALVGRLASTMAHEIRNPLASMSGAAQVLSGRNLDLEHVGRMTGLIVDQAKRISETIEGYLQLSRRSGASTFEKLELKSLLQEVIEEGLPGTLADVEIDKCMRKGLVVSGNRQRLAQMMQNLLRNAAEATEGQEERIIAVGLGYNPKRGSAEITVEDNGPGFPDGLADSISRPFITTKSEGTGLGLYVVSKVAEDHSGSILLDASTLGGALVKVSLPGCSLSDGSGEGTEVEHDG